MKKQILFLIGLIAATGIMAQAPQGISHQAVIRDAGNELVANSSIGIQVSILQGSAEGEAVYVETHAPVSNSGGLITYVIGHGVVQSGVFSEIDWSAGPYFLKTEADPTGGTAYSISGITQFLSVPYSIHAEFADHAETFTGLDELLDRIEAIEEVLDIVPPIPYNLYLEAHPENAGNVFGTGEYQEGDEVNITATAEEGWEFVNWTGDIAHVADPTSAYTTVAMPAQNISLTANFQNILCDDGNLCTVGYWDPVTGECTYVPVDCDDGNPCTDNHCDPTSGCVTIYNNNPCDDGNACTTNNICVDGVCTGTLIDCDDGNPCTENYCDPLTGCYYVDIPDCIPCQTDEDCEDSFCIDNICQPQ